MEDVLNFLRTCEYSCENFESDRWADIKAGNTTKEEVQQAMYEYMYLRDLGDYLEELIKSKRYSDVEMAYKIKDFFNKMYTRFEKNSAKSIQTKKKATMLKQEAFSVVYGLLEDALQNSGYNI